MKALFFCCISVFAFGCGKQINNSENASDDFPNKVGDTWTYNVNDTTITRSSNSSITSEYLMTVSIVDSITTEYGEKGTVWVYSYPGGSDTTFVIQRADTIRFVDVPDIGFSAYSRQYVVPLTLHQSWKYTVPSLGEVMVSDQHSIVVGQNRFDGAYHIRGTGGMPDALFTVDEWTEKKVGTIKRYFNSSGFSVNTIHATSWSLISYQLK